MDGRNKAECLTVQITAACNLDKNNLSSPGSIISVNPTPDKARLFLNNTSTTGLWTAARQGLLAVNSNAVDAFAGAVV